MKIMSLLKGMVVICAFINLPVFGQDPAWDWNGANIYNLNSGNVGIGTTTPSRKFQVQFTDNLQYSDPVTYGGILVYNPSTTANTGAQIILGTGSAMAGILGRRVGSNRQALDFWTENSSRTVGMTLNYDGKLGIGTTSPSNKLDVYGGIDMLDYLRHRGDINTYIGFPANDQIRLRTNGYDRLTVSSNGNIGIGTTSPEGTFNVVGGTAGSNVAGVPIIVLAQNAGSSNPSSPGQKGGNIQLTAGNGGSTSYNICGSGGDVKIEAGDGGSGPSGYCTQGSGGNILLLPGIGAAPDGPPGVVGIGDVGTIDNNDRTFKLLVAGKIRAEEIVVETGWFDFVFNDDYQLPSLEQVEQHIKENKHLPDIPSEEEVVENGVSLGEMQGKLLQKIEELTLYVIKQEKMIAEQNEKIKNLETKINGSN